MQPIIRVVVFDDNPQRRDGLELLINTMDNMVCVATYNDCQNAVKHVEETEPDVVLMDIDMPNINGIDGTRILKEKNPI